MSSRRTCTQGHDVEPAEATHCPVCGQALPTRRRRTPRAVWAIAWSFAVILLAALGVGAYFVARPWIDPMFAEKPRVVLAGFPGAVRAVAFAPDGQTLVSGGDGGVMTFWDVSTGRERDGLESHQGHVYSLAIAPDGQTLASGGSDGTVKLWDMAAKVERAALGGREHGSVRSLAFAPDGQFLATAGVDSTVKVWDLKSEKLRDTLKHSGPVMTVAFSSDGKTLASGSDNLLLRLWDVGADQPRATLQGNPGGGYGIVHATAFAPEGGPVAWGLSTTTVKVSDPASGQELLSLTGHTGNVFCVAFAPHGNRLASGGPDGTARLWDPKTGEALTVFRGHDGGVNSVAFSPDGRILACAAGDIDTPGSVKLWNVPGN